MAEANRGTAAKSASAATTLGFEEKFWTATDAHGNALGATKCMQRVDDLLRQHETLDAPKIKRPDRLLVHGTGHSLRHPPLSRSSSPLGGHIDTRNSPYASSSAATER